MTLTDYEIDVLRIMLKSEFNDSEIENIISTSSITGYEYTGAGYFLKLKNELFPIKRKVIAEPVLIGKTKDLNVGFVLFLENRSLTLECHSWENANPPENFRTRRVEIKKMENI